jgi:hypothetical protein
MAGIAFLLAIIGVIAVVVLRALRQLVMGGRIGVSRPQAVNLNRGSSARLSTRIVDDGFWIESSEHQDGAMLDCRYAAEGRPHHENITFRAGPRGHFVFTGSRPTSVSVTVHPGSLPHSLAQRAAAMELGMQAIENEPSAEKSQPFRGHPPAY